MRHARTRFLIGALLATILWLVMLVSGGSESPRDEAFRQMLYAADNAVLARNASFLTWFGGWQVLTGITIAAAIYVALRRRRARAALLLFIVFGGRLVIEIQKMIVDRQRPGIPEHLEAVHTMAFPSGHAANAMITYMAIALLVPVRQRMRAIAVGLGLAVALQVGWSRVALGVHWPSDVVGGWAFGLLWVMICMRLATDRPGD